MYNTQNLSQPQPSAGQLVRSTITALIVAMILLVCVVLPSEYAVDPTGAGRLLGLTEMGEIKQQLAEEAAADSARSEVLTATPVITSTTATPTPTKTVTAPAVTQPTSAPIVETETAVTKPEPVKPAPKSKTVSFVLKPGQGAEIKLEMKQNARVNYSWSANGGKLNYDTHGDPYDAPKGFYHGYGKGRFVPGESGKLKAAFDGKHGWFWRNRTKQDVTMTLEVSGDFIQLKRVI
ncbi:transmembrane anchor protein [Aliamphritea ceti]|uniref:transmembrane anchor protein n=1 Tax=Aliamphritea ceti TaxID=1524258 RepID=UPI0021C467DD|nr:transmembrane anchor protein [Aliamphritea ceti]